MRSRRSTFLAFATASNSIHSNRRVGALPSTNLPLSTSGREHSASQSTWSPRMLTGASLSPRIRKFGLEPMLPCLALLAFAWPSKARPTSAFLLKKTQCRTRSGPLSRTTISLGPTNLPCYTVLCMRRRDSEEIATGTAAKRKRKKIAFFVGRAHKWLSSLQLAVPRILGRAWTPLGRGTA